MRKAIDAIMSDDPKELIKTEIEDTLAQLESMDKDTEEIEEELEAIRETVDDEETTMFDVAEQLGDLKELKKRAELD